jgi:hypothetical protein
MAMVESDLSVIDPKLDDIIGCLVKGTPKSWQPSQDWQIGPLAGEDAKVTLTGADFEEAYDNIQNFYLKKWWGDGLPVGAATQKRIDWLMTGVEHDPDEVVAADAETPGQIPTSNRILTYGRMANAMAMAGGRPEYMPLAEAVCKIIINRHSSRLASSMSSSPFAVVNGPMTDQIRLGNGFHLWGPDPKRPAGRVMSRFWWFVHQNVGNMLVGKGTIGQYGDTRPGICFAENETGLPTGWTTYAEDQYGHPKGTNSVTYGELGMGSFVQYVMRGGGSDTLEDELSGNLDRLVEVALRVPDNGVPEDARGRTAMLIWNAHVCRFYANSGWTKEGILDEVASRFWYNFDMVSEKVGVINDLQEEGINPASIDPLTRYKLFTDPTRLHFVVAGGDHTSQSRYIDSWAPHGNMEIELPSNWNSLLDQAEDDLGPMPPKGEGGVDL